MTEPPAPPSENQAVRTVARQARAMGVLRRCHRELLRAVDVDSLMSEVCAIAVSAGYRLAWVGRCEGTGVVPIARAGRGERDLTYVDCVNATWLDDPRGRGPTGTAIRTGKPSVCRNLAEDPSFASWRPAAIERGYAASIALPLGDPGRAWGMLAVYAEELEAFDDHEVALLQDLAGSLSHGVEVVRERNARLEAEQHVLHLNAVLHGIRAIGRVITRERDPGQLIQDACDALVSSRGFEFATIILMEGDRVTASAYASPTGQPAEVWTVVASGTIPPCFGAALDTGGAVEVREGDSLCAGCVGRGTGPHQGDFVTAPLHAGGRSFGVMCVLMPKGTVSDAEERSLLEEIAGDLSFGLLSIETEAKRSAAVEALRESEARFHALFESSIEGIALHELVRDGQGRAVDYRIVDANAAFVLHTGIAIERARGALAGELYGVSEPPYLERYVRVVESGEPCRFEVAFGPLDREFRISAFQLGRDGFATVFEDITQRKRDERQLSMSAARQAALRELAQREFASEKDAIDFALEAAVELTASEIGYVHFVESDQQNLSLFTWSRKALDQCTVSRDRHYPLSEAGIWADSIRLRRPVVHNDYLSEPTRKGLPAGHSPVLRHMSTCVIDQGKVVAVAGVGNKETDYQDDDVHQLQVFLDGVWMVVARMRAMEELRGAAVRWSATFDAIKDAVCVISPRYEIIAANDAACRMFGRPPAELAGCKCYDLMHGTSGPIPGCPCDQAARTGEQATLTLEQGDRLYELTAWPMGSDGTPSGFVHVIVDMTEDRRRERERAYLEEQLRAAQRLEAIGKLAGGVAHDFNNLLSVIINYAQFAIDQLREGGALREDMLEILRAAERAASLTRQLLAFSRKQILRPEVIDLNDIVESMEGMLRRLIGEDIELCTALSPGLARIKADPGQLEQVVMNIVVNARDAMGGGGKVTIETSNVALDEAYTEAHESVSPGPHVMLSVTDSGGGMDEPTKARVFEPFFTTKAPGKGTGLGLSTVYGIVKQSGGNICVFSEPGRGTAFKLYFPAVEDAGEHRPSTVPRHSQPGTETLLLVEDEAGVRKLTRRVLEAAGYRVLVAENGAEALAVCERHTGALDLVLTDVVMPRMGGKELVDQLAKARPGLKVLYMSGYTDDAIVHHGVLDAGTNFIAKPFSASALARKVRDVLDGSGPDGPPPDP